MWSSTKRLGVLPAVLTFAVAALSASGANSQTPGFEYAVKFVCGRAVATPTGLPPVAPGYYWTDINVHNPNSETIKFRKKFVLALINQKQSKPTDFFSGEFGPDFAFAVECREILGRLGSPPFATGFAVFQSDRQLDIVAVYTTGATATGPVSTFHTERVPKRP